MVEYGFVGSIKPSGLLYPNISALLICLQIDYIKLIAICQYLFEKNFFCNKCVLNNCLMAAVVPRSATIISESPDVKLIPTCGRTKVPRQKLPGQLIFRSVCRLSEFRFTVKKGLGVPFFMDCLTPWGRWCFCLRKRLYRYRTQVPGAGGAL